MDSLKGMAIFATVVDKGSMAAAAQSLGMTPSAVSQQIRKLESRAQVTLLHRTTRRLTLTEAGEAFYRSCAQMLAIAEEAEQRLGEWRDAPVGELRLAAPVGFSGTLITQALKPLLENHRQLRLQLFFQDERIDLVAERIDLAIRVGNLADSSLVARHLGDWSSVLCAAPAYLSQHGQPLRPEALREHECIRFSLSGHADRWTFRKERECIAVPIAGRYRVSSSLAVRDALLAGFGLSLIPRLYVQAELAEGRLVELLAGWKADETAIHAVYPSRQLAGKTRVFLDFLTETMAQGHDSPTL